MYFFKLIRYKNLLMVFLTMMLTKYGLIASSIQTPYLSHYEFLILMMSVLLITAGGYIINDIYDVENDKINKINKLFIEVCIPLKTAWKYYFLCTFFGLLLGIYISIVKNLAFHSFYFLLTSVSLFLYSKYLKNTVLIGNILVSILCALVIYLVFTFDFRIDRKLFLDNISRTSIQKLEFGQTFVKFYILFSFLTTLVREIIKDIEDIDGDLKVNAKTLPILIGRQRAAKVSFFFTGILFITLLVTIQVLRYNSILFAYYIILLLLPMLYFMYILWFAKSKKDHSKLSSLMKLIMLLGILSMYVFRVLEY